MRPLVAPDRPLRFIAAAPALARQSAQLTLSLLGELAGPAETRRELEADLLAAIERHVSTRAVEIRALLR